jgi:hypothetical protein
MTNTGNISLSKARHFRCNMLTVCVYASLLQVQNLTAHKLHYNNVGIYIKCPRDTKLHH